MQYSTVAVAQRACTFMLDQPNGEAQVTTPDCIPKRVVPVTIMIVVTANWHKLNLFAIASSFFALSSSSGDELSLDTVSTTADLMRSSHQ